MVEGGRWGEVEFADWAWMTVDLFYFVFLICVVNAVSSHLFPVKM